MSLLRFAGRVLFSAYYVSDGYQLLTKPDQNADQVAATVDRIVPAVQSFLPPDAADRVPEDARTWTRILGLAQIVGGVAYASGFARRPGAILLAAASLPRLVGSAQANQRSGLLAQLAMFGAAVTASQDTAGRPGLAWRAEQSRKAVTKGAQKTSDTVGRNLSEAEKIAKKTAQQTAKKVQRQVKGVLN